MQRWGGGRVGGQHSVPVPPLAVVLVPTVSTVPAMHLTLHEGASLIYLRMRMGMRMHRSPVAARAANARMPQYRVHAFRQPPGTHGDEAP